MRPRQIGAWKMGMTIIKNYGMPHNCYDCDLHNYHECNLTNESIEEDYCWNGDSREKHCPLREVEATPKAYIAEAIDKVEEYICDVETDTVKAQGMAQALDIFEKALGKAESET